ncbi:alpha/beta hydrolase domain containing protein, putative [Pediculus humanus corporis]|uniref:Alpha/beta hydrolase domain containing protein, putative n=1 Tax=Pediculus humanus subsp. corporis TaxID=121224 RepID=E0VV32_PEDHC|nr:alpha/beta hydrolase domain containing protein, putative [Pediculus humanus corporis]EEB17238.1 alpha/beta hydrolase domain containing protein, putative [Pediculus humanus corporis]
MYVLAVVAVVLCLLFRVLNVNSQPQKPVIVCQDISFLETIFKLSPIFNDPYTPPRLWGFNGHVQTILHSLLGRLRCPWPVGKRTFLSLEDGSTLTYDVYEPLGPCFDDNVTIAVCPGIANTSESVYIRTFVHYAQYHGYRCAVLNHLGALSSVKLTSPRIFSYEREHPVNLISGVSVCQGYNAIEATKWLLTWNNFRRLYFFVLTEAVKSIILKHRYILLNKDSMKKFNLNEREIISAATLPELDDVFTRKIYKFNSVDEMYIWSSSVNYLQNIKHPIVFINSKDDPLVPEELLDPVKNFCISRDKTALVLLSHGGHLGFYEGGLMSMNPVSWLDKALIGLVSALVLSQSTSK